MRKALEIIKPHINQTMYEEILKDYDYYKVQDLTTLGIDSLSFFQVVLEVEKKCNKSFDFIELDVNKFSTLDKLEDILKEEEHEI
ncbi:hypothetical protein ACVU02_000590 [Listeria monocytogenes]